MVYLVLGLVLFLGIHSVRVFAPQLRERAIASMGEGPWKGIYSLVSLVGLVLMIWGFGVARETTGVLYDPPVGLRHLTLLLMLLALISLSVSIFPAGRLKPILKHPMLLSVKIWAFAHLLANGETSSVVLFGAILAWAVIDRISLKRRNAPVPAAGPVTWDIASVVVAVVVYLLIIWRLHVWLIGVPVM